jgi:hypothetical protein
MSVIKPASVQRVVAFGAGIGSAGLAYAYVHRCLWSSTAGVLRSQGQLPAAQVVVPEPLYGMKSRAIVAQRWNSFIDSSFGWFLQSTSSKKS